MYRDQYGEYAYRYLGVEGKDTIDENKSTFKSRRIKWKPYLQTCRSVYMGKKGREC